MSEAITYKAIQNQNTTLYNSILNMSEMYSTDASRIIYKNTSFANIRYISGFMFYAYYATFLIFMLMLFFSRTTRWWIKVLLVAVFLVYPFGIYYLENWIYQLVAYVANVA